VKKTLVITAAIVVAVAVGATAALFALAADAGSHQTCGKVNPAEIRAAADPNFGKKLETLARCGY
jgi:mRNA-degrading endonuclease toxin of MazEF toxin-antitoxin module